jgi:hypothetical protein
MILIGGTQSNGADLCTSVTLFTTKFTGPWIEPGHRGDRSATDSLSHGTAIKVKINRNYEMFVFFNSSFFWGVYSPKNNNFCLPIFSFTSVLELTARSSQKSKTMILLGQDPLRCKITVPKKCLQHVKNFKYIGFEMPYEN